MITIDSTNRISIDGRPTGLAVTQRGDRTVVYTPEDRGAGTKYAEHAMPAGRYSLAHEAPATGIPGRLAFEADLRAICP